MIEDGTAQDVKENILKHLLWKPGPEAVDLAQQCFLAEADKLTQVEAELIEFEHQGTQRPVIPTYPVIRVTFHSKRERGAVVTKSVRAARRARLTLYRLETTNNGTPCLYMAFLRADE